MLKDLSELTQDAIALFEKAAQEPKGDILKKAGIEQSTGLVAYDLQAPAKNLVPILTPLRNVIPRVSGGGGTATNWKRVTGINTGNLQGFVPEGTRNGIMPIAVDDKSANYKSLGMEDSITYEAELAAKGFENIRATQAQRLLWATMLQEEYAILGANYSVALETPTAPTVTVIDGGGTIADGTYNVIVVALTSQGYMSSSVSGGVLGEVTVSPAGGGTNYTYGGGSSNKSSATSTGAISNGGDSIIQASTPVVNGAVAYAWDVGVSGSEKLQSNTPINNVALTSLVTTTQNASAITADNSKNLLGYDGILYTAWNSGSNAYVVNMADGTAGVGTGLTADTDGGIVEINTLFRHMWDEYKLSPSVIHVSAQEADNITSKVLSASAARVNYVSGAEFAGGARIKSLLNRFAMGTTQNVPIEIHPNLPAGTLLTVTQQLPYPVNGVPNVMEMRMRQDYYQMEWAKVSRKYETGVYSDGVFAHYFPPSIGIITNIGDA